MLVIQEVEDALKPVRAAEVFEPAASILIGPQELKKSML